MINVKHTIPQTNLIEEETHQSSDSYFLSFRLIPKKLMSSYTGMEECEEEEEEKPLREK